MPDAPQEEREFIQRLVGGVLAVRAEVDQEIGEVSRQWSLHRVAAVDRAWSQPDMPRSLAAYWRQPPGRLDLVDVESHQSREFSRAMRSAPRLLAELDRHWRGETGKATGTRGAWCAAALVERAHTAYGAAQYRLRREVEAAVAASPTAARVRGEVVAQAGARTKRGIIARVFGLWRDMVEDT